ncbi:hypothetical protein [Streptomyces sp. C184]|uniref:hypothetical protein n=1 Tax=Streptomyces sp. C184 TaxID=3237121 RepID=UPI0034C6722A
MVSSEADAVDGLRTAVNFYEAKTARLLQRRVELEKELAELDAEFSSASAARDHLVTALSEITATDDVSSVGVGDPADVRGAGPHDPVAEEDCPAASERPRPQPSAGKRNRQLGQQVLQVLATAGRPLQVKEIAEALGRPISGKAGTSAVETVRKTCKRHVDHGRAAETEPGVFVIASASSRGMKGAA